MKKILFVLLAGLLMFAPAYAKEETQAELKKDYKLFQRDIYHNIIAWEEEFQDFNEGIYQNILNNHAKLAESDMYIAKEFARVSQSLLRQIIKELNRITFSTKTWTLLNEKLITICYLQKYNLELLQHVPLSQEDYDILLKSRILVKDLQVKWEEAYQALIEKSLQ